MDTNFAYLWKIFALNRRRVGDTYGYFSNTEKYWLVPIEKKHRRFMKRLFS